MKKIEAIVRAFKLEDIRAALLVQGVTGMTISEVRGYGRQRGHSEIYRGSEYHVEFVPKVKIELVVTEANLSATLETIMNSAHTGQVGDGKIFVSEVGEMIRIRTGETGEAAT